MTCLLPAYITCLLLVMVLVIRRNQYHSFVCMVGLLLAGCRHNDQLQITHIRHISHRLQ